MHVHHAAGFASPGVWRHFSEAVCLGWQVYCSGGQRETRGRELFGLIGEQRELIFLTGSSQIKRRGKESLIRKQTKLASRQAGYKKSIFFLLWSGLFFLHCQFIPSISTI
jgi:hypothetical protein